MQEQSSKARGKTSPIPELKNKEWLRQKYIVDNLSGEDIGKLLGCTKHPVMRALKKHGITARLHSSKYTQLNDKEWLRKKYIDEKMSIPDIANIVGCKVGAIHSSLTHMGIKTRSYKEGLKTKFPNGRWGEDSSNWRGGVSLVGETIRASAEYNEWRLAIYKRDKFACVWDGSQERLEADHYPKPFAKIIHENSIRTFKDALACAELWDINNGRTLCHDCHQTTESFGARLKPIDLQNDIRTDIEKKIDALMNSKRYYQQRNWQLQNVVVPKLREEIRVLKAAINGDMPQKPTKSRQIGSWKSIIPPRVSDN